MRKSKETSQSHGDMTYLVYGAIALIVIVILYAVYRSWKADSSSVLSFFRAIAGGYSRGSPERKETE